MKQEASKFCAKFGNLNKKTVLRCVEEFVKEKKKQVAEVSLIIFKEKGGSEGKRRGRYDIPPKTYCPRDLKAFKITTLYPRNGLVRCDECNLEISKREEIIKHIESAHKETLKRAFAKELLSLAIDHKQYHKWLSRTLHVDFGDSVNRRDDHVCKSATEDVSENKTTITRNLPSGPNIFETQTTKITLNKNGTTKKSVIIEQTANITPEKESTMQMKTQAKLNEK